ncbi:CRAL-TRIO domain-containing protein [Boletus reticuloceps]|uniref:CRAL-TRIO domain-containing protein n=1 Tax=Boletus reticuloceps TaxID=495285 RepID=A0A8I2YC14_9AGAM|nr:CRAL-TRIO domain-containing protein [Boletus reticuloceps]
MMDSVILQTQNDSLVLQFNNATADLAALLDTLHDHVLQQLQLELALSDPDTVWLSEWLSDQASVFRLLRRHKFIRPFTLQEIRSIAIWRLRTLRPTLLLPIPTLLHCLPPPITDPFGRPIVFLKLTSLQSLTCSVHDVFLQEVERLRLHLRYIRDHCAHTGPFPLQYIVLIDLDGLSIQNYNLDLCSWILSDIIPRYPGMLAAVFLLNHSWLHSGAWSVAKRILPASIIARVFFPSSAQLVSYCSATNLPAEYGGSLPTLDQIDDALRSPYQTQHLPPLPPLSDISDASPALPFPSSSSSPAPPPDSTLQRSPSTIALPPLSSRNPFFGYPAIASASSPHTIRHVQRGPRELLRTLAVLWWRRRACLGAAIASPQNRDKTGAGPGGQSDRTDGGGRPGAG